MAPQDPTRKPWKDITPLSWFWLIITIIGNPFYNMVAYLLTLSLGASQNVGTNVVRIDWWPYLLFLLLIFAVRVGLYKYFIDRRNSHKVGWPYFMELFVHQHKIQLLGLLIFIALLGDVEGNIMGFIYFPLTLVLSLIVAPIIFNKLRRMQYDNFV